MSGPDDQAEALESLVDAYTELLEAGRAPSVDAFARAHPEHEDALRTVLPALRRMHAVRSDVEAQRDEEPVDVPGQIGPYRVEHLIGRGGMGRVFLARDPEDGPVALKLVHPHLVGDDGFLRRFLREAQIGQDVVHPNVVRTLAAGGGRDADPPYIVMEFVEGQDLRALLSEAGVVSERLARVVAVALADALTAIHDAGILHRDVKPENVILAAGDVVKLMDLGVARLIEERERLSGTGEFVGSLLYAAPEQLTGAALDGRADLFALGLLLFELVVGRHPREVLRERERSAVVSLPTAASSGARISPFFDAVIETLLASRPSRRFESAQLLGRVLREGERSAWWLERKGDRVRAASRRLNAAFAPTSFRGRDTELDRLREAFADAREGRGQVVLIQGEAGLGKSRLLAEFLDEVEAATGDVLTLVASHAPGTQEMSVAPLAAALFEASESPLKGDPTWAGDALKHLRGDAGAGASAAVVAMTYVRALRQLADDSPVVLVVEDLHFASEETRSVFVTVARSIHTSPILLVGTTRPKPAPPWPRDLDGAAHARAIALEPLEAEVCAKLIQELAAARSPTVSRVRELADRSDGNPLFLLELAREQLRTDTGARDVPIPASIHEMLERRFDRLDAQSRELLQAAACVGHVFDPALAAQAAAVPVIEALKRFGRIERETGLVVTEGMDYRFQHHVVRDAFYEGMHGRLRAAYHTTIGDAVERAWLRTEGPEIRPSATTVTLARQFLESEQPERAVPYLQHAAEHMFRVRERRGVHVLMERALAIDGLLTGITRAYTLRDSAVAISNDAPPEQLVPNLQEALILSVADVDPLLTATVYRALAVTRSHYGDFRGIVELLENCPPLFENVDAPDEEASMLVVLGGALTTLHRTDEARPHLERALQLSKDHDLTWIGEATVRMAILECDVGRHDEAMEVLTESLRIARERGDREAEAAAHTGAAHVSMITNRIPEAARHAQAALDFYFEQANSRNVAIWSHMLSGFLVQLGSFEEGAEIATRGIEWSRRFGDVEAAAFNGKQVAWARLAQGRLAEACQHLEDAIAVGEELTSSLLIEQSRSRLADCYVAMGAFDEAESCHDLLHEALKDAQADAEVRRLDLADGRLAAARGQHESAYEAFQALKDPVINRVLPGTYSGVLLGLACSSASIGSVDACLQAVDELEPIAHMRADWNSRAWIEVLRALHADGDLAAAARFVDDCAERLQVSERAELYQALHEATGDPAHLRAAHEAVEVLRAHTPEEHRGGLDARYRLPPR